MTVTNTDEKVVDDDKTVTEDDLRDLKYPKDDVETSEEADETSEGDEAAEDTDEAGDEADKTDDSQEEDTEEQSEAETEFVKEFSNIKGDTLEEYARNLEKAYNNSTAEFKRLREEAAQDTGVGDTTADEVDLSSPTALYMKQKMDEEITTAYTDFSKNYPQVQDQTEYDKFTRTVTTLSQTILQSEKRLASPKELYTKAAVILNWEPDNKVSDKDRLGNALKNTASISKSATSTKKSSKSKVTDQMVAANKLMYPDKTDAEIREELEPYVT